MSSPKLPGVALQKGSAEGEQGDLAPIPPRTKQPKLTKFLLQRNVPQTRASRCHAEQKRESLALQKSRASGSRFCGSHSRTPGVHSIPNTAYPPPGATRTQGVQGGGGHAPLRGQHPQASSAATLLHPPSPKASEDKPEGAGLPSGLLQRR